jgi:glycosyltransferase involved in cell wall biosynthesis
VGATVRVLYVSYDGLLDPLGHSQVLPYVTRLAASGIEFAIVSFEKRSRWEDDGRRRALADGLARTGIRWVPLRYHKSPRSLATAWDVLRGAATLRSEARRVRPRIVHCRGDVAAAMARWSGATKAARLLYDVRGFFSDERVESGSWRAGGVLDRLVRRVEGRNLRAAAGVVVLTRAAHLALAERQRLPPHRVIPTCADLDRFRLAASDDAPRYGLVYSGSLGSWYMGREMLAFARVAGSILGAPTLFLTPDGSRLKGLAPDSQVEVREAAPADVPGWLRQARAQFFFYQPSPARRATCPTKLAEGLACGLPVLCNRGIGDVDELVQREGVGVLVDGFTDAALQASLRDLRVLLDDPGIHDRCRSVATRVFDVRVGSDQYRSLYREMAGLPAEPGGVIPREASL